MEGDILLFTGKGDLWGNLISWWTHSRFVHCAVDIGTDFCIEAVGAGVIARPINQWPPAARWSYGPTSLLSEKALDWLKSMIGQPYGANDLVTAFYEQFITTSYTVQMQHYDCSALATEFLIQAGRKDALGMLELAPHTVTPAMLAKQLGVK